MRIAASAFAMGALMMLGGCVADHQDPPELGTKLTYDGLAKVEDRKALDAWMRPDFSLTGYTKIMLVGAGIEYRPVKQPVSRTAVRSAAVTEFPLTLQQKARLRSIVSDAFKNELAQSKRFQLVDQPGPDVVTIWGGLVDVVSHVPPTPTGRSSIYLTSVGQATLVVELRDSESNAVLLRVIDRRAAQLAQSTPPAMRSSSVANWSEVKRLARRWAIRLRTTLDEAATWDYESLN